ncbi:MAG: hypothetical protein QXL09_02540 [Candidatus Aenigmatarchaeota archaeon]
MKIYRKVLILGILVAILGIASCFWLSTMFQKDEIESIRPYFPKEGEKQTLSVTSWEGSPENFREVEVTLIDLETNQSWTKLTDPDYGARFEVIVGKSYMLVAKYKSDIESIIFTMKPITKISIKISDNTIERIKVSGYG